jgi:predicted RNA-binding Zn ribbon-like protein
MTVPERLVPRVVTVYDRERQCTAPGCGVWFRPSDERHVWCSKRCGMRAYRDRLKRSRGDVGNRLHHE